MGTLEKPRLRFPDELLILDSCSQQQWLEIVVQWQEAGGHVIVLVPQYSSQRIEEVRTLYLGVRGLVPSSPELKVELPKAVRTVLSGGLWVNREVLDEYVRRTNSSVQRMAGIKSRLTIREEQVALFVVRGYSNKQIAGALGISERTVKYHVSNILQKSCAATRKELLHSVNLIDLSISSDISRPQKGFAIEAASLVSAS